LYLIVFNYCNPVYELRSTAFDFADFVAKELPSTLFSLCIYEVFSL